MVSVPDLGRSTHPVDPGSALSPLRHDDAINIWHEQAKCG
jgi:hypothetical protein